jgi:hypothetical protein
MSRLSARSLALVLVLVLSPARGEEPNLSVTSAGTPGGVTRLVLAQRAYQAAMTSGDTITLVAAIRLARSVTLRRPTAWERTTAGDASADQPAGRDAAPDPASAHAVAIAQGLAGEDPDLQDLVYDLDAQLPHGRLQTVTFASAKLGGGQTDSWRMPFFGEVSAEIALIGDGDSLLGLTLTDDGGAVLCAAAPGRDPAHCRFTPARNGFFTVEVRNPGTVINSYRLIAN